MIFFSRLGLGFQSDLLRPETWRSGPRKDYAEIFRFLRLQSLPRGFCCVWRPQTLIYFLRDILTS